MDTVGIIQEIDSEISRLQQVQAILAGTTTKRGPGRPKTTEGVSETVAAPTKRVMSTEGRAKIAEAQKARWAKLRKAEKKTARKAAASKTTPAKKSTKKSVKSAKPIKATKLAKEDKPESKG